MKRFVVFLLVMGILCGLCTAFASATPMPVPEGRDLAKQTLTVLEEKELPRLQMESRETAQATDLKPASRHLSDDSYVTPAPLVKTPSAVRGQELLLRNVMYCNGDENQYFFIAIYPSNASADDEPVAYYAEEIPYTLSIEYFTLTWDGYQEVGTNDYIVIYFTVQYAGNEAYVLEDTYIELSAKIFDSPRPATGLAVRQLIAEGNFFGGPVLTTLRLALNYSFTFALGVEPAACTTKSEPVLSFDSTYLDVGCTFGMLSIVPRKAGWTTMKITLDQAVLTIPIEICLNYGHNTVESRVISEPTEETNGITRYTCPVCCEYYEERTWLTPRVFETFKDISEFDWFCKSVQFAVDRGLFNGVASDRFAPNDVMTRAMLVTVLYRYSGESVSYEPVFEDVPAGIWYSEAVTWAAKNEIVNGMGKGKFAPDGTITREQMATILYRYANKLGADTSKRDSLDFPDLDKLSSWAKDGVQWAVAEGLIQGSSVGGVVQLLPDQGATRAQVATILMRFVQNIKIPETPVESSAWEAYAEHPKAYGVILNEPVDQAPEATVTWIEGEYECAYIIPRYVGSTVNLYSLIWDEGYNNYTIGETPDYSTVAEDGCVIYTVLPRPEGAPSCYIELVLPNGEKIGWVLQYDGRDGTPPMEFFEK